MPRTRAGRAAGLQSSLPSNTFSRSFCSFPLRPGDRPLWPLIVPLGLLRVILTSGHEGLPGDSPEPRLAHARPAGWTRVLQPSARSSPALPLEAGVGVGVVRRAPVDLGESWEGGRSGVPFVSSQGGSSLLQMQMPLASSL